MDQEEDGASSEDLISQLRHAPASTRVLYLAKTFPALNARSHRLLHAVLAEMARSQMEFLDNPFEHVSFLDDFKRKFTVKPRGLKTSHDVARFVTSASSRGAVRLAGCYAIAVDYAIAHAVGDLRSYFKQHSYTGVLEMAREEKRAGRRTRDLRPVVRVRISGASKQFVDFITNPTHKIEVDFRCVCEPGRKPKFIGIPTSYFEVDPPNLSPDEEHLHKQRLERVEEARRLLQDRMLYASGWPEPQDI